MVILHFAGGLKQTAYIAIAEGKIGGTRSFRSHWNMVRYQHAIITDVTIGAHRFDHVHRTFVREYLNHHIIAVPAHISKMDQKNLLARSEPTDHVVNLRLRI